MRRNPTVYQIYPRSFQDSNGDGVGDLAGITARLDYLHRLGVDAVWLSPIFQSPMRDGGYDVSDFMAIDPIFGTDSDFDELIAKAKRIDIGVLLDIVACHTSIDHPWFRQRPEFYIWHDGDNPPNNWKSAFGGSAWTRDEHFGRWYLHTFYDHQPQLNWRIRKWQRRCRQSCATGLIEALMDFVWMLFKSCMSTSSCGMNRQ